MYNESTFDFTYIDVRNGKYIKRHLFGSPNLSFSLFFEELFILKMKYFAAVLLLAAVVRIFYFVNILVQSDLQVTIVNILGLCR